MTLRNRIVLTIAALSVPIAAEAQVAAQSLRPDQQRFRALYQELVETDTSITTGSCTALADKVETRLKAAGYPDSAITRFAVPDHPKEGGLVVVLPGSSRTAKPMLLLGHIDVVVAKAEDWTRDPYKMVEENGYFYGRGTSDMKAMDAIWIDTLIRFKQDGYRPKRTIKLALTCGEETRSTKAAAAAPTARAIWSSPTSMSARRRRSITGSRRPIRAATARRRCATMRSTSWPMRSARYATTSFRCR
jgi:arginine utilization protein RocB